jgi:tetratricopeptide (TPR) repeat protein
MMKKILILTFAVLILLLPSIQVHADSPYTTWTMGPGGFLYMCQDAYSPFTEIYLDISGAEDMFVTPDGFIYIADTGNGRIVKLDKQAEVVATYGDDILESPSGIYVDPEGTIYVTDSKKNTINILDAEGNLINEFGRPSEPLFGVSREFLPRKIAVDARKNLYIISEGSVDGIVQMNTNGNFIGYFGANTATMSLKMILQRMFLTEEQLSQFVKNEAASPSNIAIDNQSMVYTITAGTNRFQSIRKYTVSGRNIFPNTRGSSQFQDIDVSDDGLILAVAGNGQVFEYELNGRMLFIFGAQDMGDQRMGTLLNATAIDRYEDFILILDKDKNAIIAYQKTAFAKIVHSGVRLYMDGFYEEAKPYFEEVINYNGSFIMSYQAIADAYYKERNYSLALKNYRLAEDRNGYSQAFWEMRNGILQKYLTNAILLLFAFSVGQVAVKRLDKRYGWFDPARKWFRGLLRYKLIDDFAFMFRFIKQPADSFYYVKKNLRGSVKFAFILYAWVIISRIITLYVTGFTFSPFSSFWMIRVENEILMTGGLILLWNAANYLVSTISDGEGRVRDVFIGSAYSLFPYALLSLPIALISNVLTLNEIFLYSFSMNMMYLWTGIMLFIMVKEVHNYSLTETIKNVLLTIFTIGLFILTGYILFVLFNQLYEFISAILQEVRLRG